MGKRNKESIVYVDMDNTFCNYAKAYNLALLNEPGIIYPQSQYRFFENLEPIDEAIESYWKLKEEYFVLFLSRPSSHNPLCYTEKRMWI